VEVARGATYTIANSVVNSVVSVVAFAFIARLISRDDMGGLAVLVVVVNFTQIIAGLGVGAAATRFVAFFQGKGEEENMRRVAYESVLINALATITIGIIVYFAAPSLAAYVLNPTWGLAWFQLLTLEIGAVGLGSSFQSVLVGLKKFKQLAVVSAVSFAVRQALVVVLLLLGWGVPGVIMGWSMGDSLSAAAYAALTFKFLGRPCLGFGVGKLLTFSWPLFLGDVANYAWTFFDRLLLIPLVGLSELGAYNVAVTAYGMLSAFPSAIAGVLFPFYAGFHGENSSDTSTLQNAIGTASRYVSLFTIPLCVGLAVTTYPAVSLLAGQTYADAALPLAVLSVSLAVSCQVRALSQIFVVLEKPLTSGLVSIASVILPILAGAVMIPMLGIVGAAAARGLSLVVSLAVSIIVLGKYFKVRLDMRAYFSAWAASLVMGLALLVLQQIIASKYLFPVYVLFGGFIYLAALRALKVIGPADLSLMSDFLGERFLFLTTILGKILGTRPTRTNGVNQKSRNISLSRR